MKRKFSFNLAPVKVSSKSEVKASPEPTPAKVSHSHRRHDSNESIGGIDPLNSPFCSRQKLDATTERELRVACAQILRNFKPSDHGIDADPKLDFGGFTRRQREQGEHKSSAEPVTVRRPTGAPADATGPGDARRHRDRPDTEARYHADLPMEANTSRMREGQSARREKERDVERGRSRRSQPIEVPPSATVDSDDNKSLGTPLTSSTDTHLNSASTAPTSAAVTSERSSKRESHHLDNPAAAADAQAAEWMKQELEKRRHQLTSESSNIEHKAPARPPSRARSIRNLFSPASRSLSRTQSRDSLRTTDTQASAEPKRSGSSHGWRSWNLQRKSSSRTTSRPGTSGGRGASQETERKPEINLNRELPPLPSLDTWDQQNEVKPKEKRQSQAGAHIATMMRPQDHQQQEYAAAVRRHHRRSGSDTLALRSANSTQSRSPMPPAKSPSVTKRTGPRADTSMDFDDMMSRMDSTHDLNSHLALNSPGRSQHEPFMSPKQSCDQSHLAAPNFSRKISADMARSTRSQGTDHEYQNTVKIAPHPDLRNPESKSVLKKVFGGWMKKGGGNGKGEANWMKQLEKHGVKEGVMLVESDTAAAPVVRY